jgi:proteasome lid subunit RPN8/RPN11
MQIKREHYDRILARASLAVNEVCGMVSQTPEGEPADHYEWTNIHEAPWHAFTVSPHEQHLAFDDMRSKGTLLAGLYHSHPTQSPLPSETDLNTAFYPDAVYLIAGQIDPGMVDSIWTITGWKIDRNRAIGEHLEIIEPQEVSE